MYGPIRPWAREVRRRPCCAACTWMCLMMRLSVSKFLNSALLSAFLSKSITILADFTGQRPWLILKAFACAVRPMQPVYFLNGTHCFFSTTSAKYACAARRPIPLIALQVSYVFLYFTFRSTPIALQDLLAFLASWEYFTIVAMRSDRQ